MRRQQYFQPARKSPAPPRRKGHGGGLFILALLAFGGLLVVTGYWSPWTFLVGDRGALLSAASEAPDIGPSMLAAISGRSAGTRSVSIPPLLTPLVAAPLAGMPGVVTPARAGGAIAARPVQIRPPRMPPGPFPGMLRLPTGNGPFPAVILLHGCGGPFAGMPDWAYRLNAWGYAALMPDSLSPRGVRSVCDPAEQSKVTPSDRVGDVGAAATWLRTQPDIDPTRIAVVGLSHGGATAALATQAPYAEIGLRAAVDYYGPCADPRMHGSVPLLVLAGEADDWGDTAQTCRAYGQTLRADEGFEIHTYPGVFHAFDNGPRATTVFMGHTLAYDRAAAEDSFLRVHAFLDRRVKD